MFTVATDGLELTHDAYIETFWVLPSERVIVAVTNVTHRGACMEVTGVVRVIAVGVSTVAGGFGADVALAGAGD